MVVLVGCAKPSTVGLDSPVPSARIKATAVAAEEGDETAIPDLIRMLDSDDPLVRMMSQHALDRLTGETFGYSYADPESKRNEAIQRWASWYEAPDAISP
ncbi:MAG: HEAT repeat domain-containing protein [Phycisphaeraceae bacterium]|nr:HEAT repeat domain-containing protein [Phycisphaerales bacterium]MCB9861666.1 HEAT repeat domain-containing protein [Phycisphaeraceae bacterium]